MAQALGQELLHAALEYAANGYRVIPVTPKDKKPPLIKQWQERASDDPIQIQEWWNQWRDANIGLLAEGLLCIDIDPEGADWLADDLERQESMSVAAIQSTPRGGTHFVFKGPDGLVVGPSAGVLALGVDVRAGGSYFVVEPSRRPEGSYLWREHARLPHMSRLQLPPQWLIEQLKSHPRPMDEASESGLTATSLSLGIKRQIPEGQRDTVLTKHAGLFRRHGYDESEIRQLLLAVNKSRCQPPLPDHQVAKIARSIAAKTPDEAATALLNAEDSRSGKVADQPRIFSLGQLVSEHPQLRPSVIEGLLRKGEVMNVISAPKIGKSWLVIDLALSVATGRPWLEKWSCEQGRVLILDNELHCETIANRIPKVASARGIEVENVSEAINVCSMRGALKDLIGMREFFESLRVREYSLIICDAFYRFLPKDTDENDNGSVAELYNYLDSYAATTGASFCLIHHSTKGSQSKKSVTDVGAGAGAQSRAADSHIILRPHEEEGAVVIEGEVRSWPRPEPVVLKWDFPVWVVDSDLDPRALRDPGGRKDGGVQMAPHQFVDTFLTTVGRGRDEILVKTGNHGMSKRSANAILNNAVDLGLAVREGGVRGKPTSFRRADSQPPF